MLRPGFIKESKEGDKEITIQLPSFCPDPKMIHITISPGKKRHDIETEIEKKSGIPISMQYICQRDRNPDNNTFVMLIHDTEHLLWRLLSAPHNPEVFARDSEWDKEILKATYHIPASPLLKPILAVSTSLPRVLVELIEGYVILPGLYQQLHDRTGAVLWQSFNGPVVNELGRDQGNSFLSLLGMPPLFWTLSTSMRYRCRELEPPKNGGLLVSRVWGESDPEFQARQQFLYSLFSKENMRKREHQIHFFNSLSAFVAADRLVCDLLFQKNKYEYAPALVRYYLDMLEKEIIRTIYTSLNNAPAGQKLDVITSHKTFLTTITRKIDAQITELSVSGAGMFARQAAREKHQDQLTRLRSLNVALRELSVDKTSSSSSSSSSSDSRHPSMARTTAH